MQVPTSAGLCASLAVIISTWCSLKISNNSLDKLLVKHHVKGECNTGCYYRYHHPDKGLSKELLDIFKEHHVDIITASDAHKPLLTKSKINS